MIYIHLCIHMYVHICIHLTYGCICMNTCLHIVMRKYLFGFTYTYIHVLYAYVFIRG